MTLRYLNGVVVGGPRSVIGSGYGHAHQQFLRLMYNWLIDECGWTKIEDNENARWTHTVAEDTADGATDTTGGGDVEKFTSTSTDFSTLGIDPSTTRYYLYVTGFSTDGEYRNGFYLVDRIDRTNGKILYIRKRYSHRTDGFLLDETGLDWKLFDFYSTDRDLCVSQTSVYAVLQGTGTGGDFHLFMEAFKGQNFMKDRFAISPYADWDDPGSDPYSGGDGSWTPTSGWAAPLRATDLQGYNQGHGSADAYRDSAVVFGFADADVAFFWVRHYQYDMLWSSTASALVHTAYYFGDLDIPAVRQAVDPNPVVCMPLKLDLTTMRLHYVASSGIARNNPGHVGMLDGSDVSTQGRCAWWSENGAGNSATSSVLENGNQLRDRSFHSGNKFRLPIPVLNDASGKVELRGFLKYLNFTHLFGSNMTLTPFGNAPGDPRDRFVLAGVEMPWNRSGMYINVF